MIDRTIRPGPIERDASRFCQKSPNFDDFPKIGMIGIVMPSHHVWPYPKTWCEGITLESSNHNHNRVGVSHFLPILELGFHIFCMSFFHSNMDDDMEYIINMDDEDDADEIKHLLASSSDGFSKGLHRAPALFAQRLFWDDFLQKYQRQQLFQRHLRMHPDGGTNGASPSTCKHSSSSQLLIHAPLNTNILSTF